MKPSLRVGKTVVDIAIERVQQMRVNRGVGRKVYKNPYRAASRYFDERKVISKHRLKAA